jgi:hypothetical protein
LGTAGTDSTFYVQTNGFPTFWSPPQLLNYLTNWCKSALPG